MDNQTSNNRVYVLNPHLSIVYLNDAFNERFAKLSALTRFALSEDFVNHSNDVIYHYQMIISDFVDDLRELQTEMTRKNNKNALTK